MDTMNDVCSFTPALGYRSCKESSWDAKRHREFRNRLDLVPEENWPLNCRYFDPQTMGIIQSLDLNTNDTNYASTNEPIYYIDFGGAGIPQENMLSLRSSESSQIYSLFSTSSSRARVLFLSQWRYYGTEGSILELGVQSEIWQALLTALELPPNVVELLHENNGGAWQHVSYLTEATATRPTPCAYHVCFKSSQFELVYGRYDCLSRQTIVLIMDSDLRWERERLLSQFRDDNEPCLLQILLAVLETWLQKFEHSRWALDLAVVELETSTAQEESCQQADARPPNQLSAIRDDIASTQCHVRSIVRHSICMGKLFEAFTEAVARFYQLNSTPGEVLRSHMLDNVRQFQSQQQCQAAQANDLSWRIDTQWNVLVALRAKRDSEVIIAMAQDTRADSVLMKRMAAVSVVFLPATFLATFFSMMFIQVDDMGRLLINRNIWVYFIFTTVLSLSMWLYFRFGKQWKALPGCSGRRLRRQESPAACPAKESV